MGDFMEVISNKENSVVTRIYPELKEQAESVLDKLQGPTATAINMFSQQVVNYQEIPVEVTTKKISTNYSTLTKEQFNNEIQKGFSDIDSGDIFTSEEVQAELLKRRRG